MSTERFLAHGRAMRALVDQVRRFAAIESNVLISGETGTGKNAVARELHARGPRARRPFVVVDCAALTTTLIDSELFGHERGAFTDAVAARPGRFELAGERHRLSRCGHRAVDRGAGQAAADRRREARRAARRTDLAGRAGARRRVRRLRVEDAVREGRFRGDLFHRIGVLPIRIPPLRERPEDVAPLARHFLGRAAAAASRVAPTIAPDVLAALRDYAWPGNVRELKHVVERALPRRPRRPDASPPPAGDSRGPPRSSRTPSPAVVRRSTRSSGATSRPRSSMPAATRPRRHSCSASAGRRLWEKRKRYGLE